MINFNALNEILEMDFSQMRAKDNTRATDEAIIKFLTLATTFYSQCSQAPSKEELAEYSHIMDLITAKISTAEIVFYTKKYRNEGQTKEMTEQMAVSQALRNFSQIPTRMQYWSAGERWGENIRNPELHSKVVKQMRIWLNWINPPIVSTLSILAASMEEEKEDSLPVARKLSLN